MLVKGVLLAAGSSKRFNGCKQLAIIDEQAGQSMLNRTYDTLFSSQIDQCAIAIRKEQIQQLASAIPANAEIVFCPDAHLGMGHTIANAVASIADNVTHVLIALADQVALTTEHFNLLLSASRETPENIICAQTPTDISVPAIFPRAFFSMLANLSGDKGAKKLIKETLMSSPENVTLIALPEALIDIDSPEDLALWQQQNSNGAH